MHALRGISCHDVTLLFCTDTAGGVVGDSTLGQRVGGTDNEGRLTRQDVFLSHVS